MHLALPVGGETTLEVSDTNYFSGDATFDGNFLLSVDDEL